MICWKMMLANKINQEKRKEIKRNKRKIIKKEKINCNQITLINTLKIKLNILQVNKGIQINKFNVQILIQMNKEILLGSLIKMKISCN